MDIFTTVLTKVRTTPIKPEKLRVKSLTKDAATREIDEESGQLDEYARYKISEQAKSHQKQTHGKNQQQLNDQELDLDIVPEEPAILHKQDITQPKKTQAKDKDDDETEHLDIYV